MVKWLAEFTGVSPADGGILVSGGNVASLTAFITARTAKAPKSVKEDGLASIAEQIVLHCSKTTRTWIEKQLSVYYKQVKLGSDGFARIHRNLAELLSHARMPF